MPYLQRNPELTPAQQAFQAVESFVLDATPHNVKGTPAEFKKISAIPARSKNIAAHYGQFIPFLFEELRAQLDVAKEQDAFSLYCASLPHYDKERDDITFILKGLLPEKLKGNAGKAAVRLRCRLDGNDLQMIGIMQELELDEDDYDHRETNSAVRLTLKKIEYVEEASDKKDASQSDSEESDLSYDSNDFLDSVKKGLQFKAYFLCALAPVIKSLEVCFAQPNIAFPEMLINFHRPKEYQTPVPTEFHAALSKLNHPQQVAAQYFLNAQGISIIEGPPGTGKTTTVIAILDALYQKRERTLMTAPSNTAVQLVASRFNAKFPDRNIVLVGVASKIPKHLQSIFIDKLAATRATEKGDDFYLLDYRTQNEYRLEILENAELILCTNTVAGRALMKRMNPVTTLITDEAGSCDEPTAMIPLAHRPRRFLMAGDTKQLPPLIKSRAAAHKEFASMMWRLAHRCQFTSHMLSIQYRMTPDIRQFPSRTFYEDKLTDGPNIATRANPICDEMRNHLGYAFYNVFMGKEEQDASGSYLNRAEAFSIRMLADTLLKKQRASGKSFPEVGIITFYAAQKALLKRRFSDFPEQNKITIDTVDGFQGKERPIIMLSFVRSNLVHNIGFLTDDRRINVAITRAQFGLVMVGNLRTLTQAAKAKTIRALAKDAAKRASMFRVTKGNFVEQSARTSKKVKPDDPTYKTKWCSMFREKGQCDAGERCHRAHSKEEKRPPAHVIHLGK